MIDVDALCDAFRHDIMGGLNYDRILREAKPVDAVPVRHGRWIRVYSRPGVFKYLGWTCDQCGQRTGNEYAPQWYKFCPNCGAKMDGDDNGKT